MKKLFLIAALFSMGTAYGAKSGYSPSLLHVLEQLRHSTGMMREVDQNGKVLPPKPFVGGFEVGMRGAPGEFFLLIPYFRHQASADDVARMLKDKSPVVRVMAAYLIRTDGGDLKNLPLEPLTNDKAELAVAAGGCVIEDLTVAEVVQRIKENPDYFGERWYQRFRSEELLRKEAADQPSQLPAS
jgi:hypothetical protein